LSYGSRYYYLVEYPLTLDESSANAGSDQTLANFCGGTLSNLVSQGAYLNLTFLVFTILYGIFLVRCPPMAYYTKVFPILCVVLGAVTGSLFFRGLPSPLIFTIVSVAQVMPYYLSNYDFYMFTTAIDEKYYGWLSGLYG
jgi:hypothetical protein